MKLFSRDTFNLRKRTNKLHIAILVFVIGGFAFFLSSGFIFHDTPDILASPLNEEINVGQTHDLMIHEWVYDDEEDNMRVIIDADDFNREYDHLKVNAVQRSDGDNIPADITYDFEDNIVIRISDLDDEFEQVALELIGKRKPDNDLDDGKEEELSTLYADQRTVQTSNIDDLSDQEMTAYITSMMVKDSQKEIDEKEKDIRDNKEKMKDIDEEIEEIEADKIYKTEDEAVDADNDINALETDKEEIERDNDSLENDINQLKDRIEKLQTKQREIETN